MNYKWSTSTSVKPSESPSQSKKINVIKSTTNVNEIILDNEANISIINESLLTDIRECKPITVTGYLGNSMDINSEKDNTLMALLLETYTSISYHNVPVVLISIEFPK